MGSSLKERAMAAEIINGEAVAAEVTAALAKDVEALKAKGIAPKLAAVIATDNKGARIYANNQAKACEKIGIAYQLCELPPTSTEAEIIAAIQKLNADPAVSGTIIQMPLPEGVNARRLQAMIAASKDVEGMSPANQG